MIGRIVRSIDFQRVLGTPTKARSTHFAVHHLSGVPSVPVRPAKSASTAELSTSEPTQMSQPVDDLLPLPLPTTPGARLWLGAVVPKRHARRAVTRSLLKRQIRAAVDRQAQLPGGLWIVRLRAPFDKVHFVSAASNVLRQAARAELDAVLAAALRRVASR